MTIRWDAISYTRTAHLAQTLQLYDKLFPLEVREPHEVLLKGLFYATHAAPNTFRFLIGLEGDRVVSFATGHYMAEVNCGFVVYIGTDPMARSRGLGSQTLHELEALLTRDAQQSGREGLQAVVLETEKHEPTDTVENQAESVKRQRFFERNGYELRRDIDYVQPPLRDGGGVIPLNLFCKDFNGSDFTDRVIELETLKRIVLAMYREKYLSVNGIDVRILRDALSHMRIDADSLLDVYHQRWQSQPEHSGEPEHSGDTPPPYETK